MSDNPQQRRNGELKVCDDIWLGMFPFLEPAELNFVMALLSDRFDALVDIHFGRTTEWALRDLEVHRSEDDGARIVKKNRGNVEHLPIPQGPPPAKLIGFNRIEIHYIDDTVIAFLRHFLFDLGITLQLNIFDGENQRWDVFVQQIWPLLSSNINEMGLADYCLPELRSRVSPTVLCDCANLRSIYFCDFLTPEFPADDRREASDGQAMTKWIHTPREDGLPKAFLHYGPMLPDTVVNGLRETFLNASTAVNYIIVVTEENAPGDDAAVSTDYVPFDLENEQTRERLAFRRLGHDAWLMERGPIARDEKQWAEWKKKVMNQKNVIAFFVDE